MEPHDVFVGSLDLTTFSPNLPPEDVHILNYQMQVANESFFWWLTEKQLNYLLGFAMRSHHLGKIGEEQKTIPPVSIKVYCTLTNGRFRKENWNHLVEQVVEANRVPPVQGVATLPELLVYVVAYLNEKIMTTNAREECWKIFDKRRKPNANQQ